MDKELPKIFKKIRRHIHTKEGLYEVELAFMKYGNYRHDKVLRNNKRQVRHLVKGLTESFEGMRTYGQERETIRNNKKINYGQSKNSSEKTA